MAKNLKNTIKAIVKSTVLKPVTADILDLLEINEGGTAQLRSEVLKHIDEVERFSDDELKKFAFSGWDRFRNPKCCNDWLDGFLAGVMILPETGSHDEFMSMIYLQVSLHLSKRYAEYTKILDDHPDDDTRTKVYTEVENLFSVIECLIEKIALDGVQVKSMKSIAETVLELRRLQKDIAERYSPDKQQKVENTTKPGDKDPSHRRTHEGSTMVSRNAVINEKSVSREILSLLKRIIDISKLTISGEKPANIFKKSENSVCIGSVNTEIMLETHDNFRIVGQDGETLRSITFRDILFLKDVIMRWMESEGIDTNTTSEKIVDAFSMLPSEKQEELGKKMTAFIDKGNNGVRNVCPPRSTRLDSDLLNIVRLVCGANLLDPRHDMSTRFGPRTQAQFAFTITHDHQPMYSHSDSLENCGAMVSRSNIDNCVGRVANALQRVYSLLYLETISGDVVAEDATVDWVYADMAYGEETDNGKKKERRKEKIQQLNHRSEKGNIVTYFPLHTTNQELLSMLLNNSNSSVSYIQSDSGPENIKTATAFTAKGTKFQKDFRAFLEKNADDRELLAEMSALDEDLDKLKVRDLTDSNLKLVPCAAHAMTHLLRLLSLLEAFVTDAMVDGSGMELQGHFGSRQVDFIRDVTAGLSKIYGEYAKLGDGRDNLDSRKSLEPMFDDLIEMMREKIDSPEYGTFFAPVKTQTEYVYDVITRLKGPFLESELVLLDDNDTERGQRVLKVQLARCLHFGSFAGAMETCILMSLLETAENRGLDSLRYLELAYFGSLYLNGDIPSDEYFDLAESCRMELLDDRWIGSSDLPKSFEDLLPTSDFVAKRVPEDVFIQLRSRDVKNVIDERKKKQKS